MNVARHLLVVLLVPGKRGIRNIAAAVGLMVPVMFGVPFNASLAFATLVLVMGLKYYSGRSPRPRASSRESVPRREGKRSARTI